MPKLIRNSYNIVHIKSLLKDRFPTLHVLSNGKTVSIEGMYYLYDLNGNEIDHYQIRIQLPHDYPKSVPVVWETLGRIPRILERHIYTDKGNCCLFLFDETFKYYKETDSIIDFINGPVRTYFFSQSYFELTGKWIFGERSHGVFGILEFYSEILGTDNINRIARYLYYLSSNKVKDAWRCYCGSGEILRHCHYQKVLQYRSRISREHAINSLDRVNKLRNSLKKKAS